jgi:hypothetical protein
MCESQEDFDLKAERVQEALAEGHQEARLKAERVQERLSRMPGWSLTMGGYALDVAKDLPSAFGAVDYATFVLREAARTKQKVRVGLNGSRLVITVTAPSQGRERGMIGLEQLDFAAGLL